MTLYKRTLLVICLTLVAAVVVLYISSQLILLKSYEQLEVQDTAQHVQRAVNTLNADIAAFKLLALTWSRWNDVRDFIREPQSAIAKHFVSNHLINGTYVNADLDVTIFLNMKGEVVFKKAVDATTKKEISVPSSLLSQLEPGSPLLDHPDVHHEITGVLSLPEGHLELVSLPVSNSIGDGPMNGYLIWGRYLTENVVSRFSGITGTNISLLPFSAVEFSNLQKTALANDPFFVQPVNEDRVAGYGLVNDVYGKPSLVVRAEVPRLIYGQGKANLSYFLIALMVVALVFTVVSLWLLERMVLSRLTLLSASVTRIRLTNDLTTKITVKGDDELGNLAAGLKDMLASLGQSRTKLEEANRELEKRVAERTTDLVQANAQLQQEITERQQAQTQLAQTRDQALEALSLKTQILANISHDSRTPLTTISLNTEMLQSGRYGEINEKQHSVLDRILASTQQLLSFINTLLDEAQINSGKMRLAHSPLEPKRLMEDMAKVLLPLAERKGIELKTEVADDVPARLLGDPDRLKRVVTNLVENAIKFTDEGSVRVGVMRRDADHWTIQVRDSGLGIPAEVQSRIFEAFWQINSTATHDSNRGVGLGLSIVRQLVTLMKGEISVESMPDSGSTFTVTLPIEEEMSEPTPELVGHPG